MQQPIPSLLLSCGDTERGFFGYCVAVVGMDLDFSVQAEGGCKAATEGYSEVRVRAAGVAHSAAGGNGPAAPALRCRVRAAEARPQAGRCFWY